MKFSLRDLNPNSCPLYPTNTYTCGVIITPKVCDGTLYNCPNTSETRILIPVSHTLRFNLCPAETED